MGIKPRQKEVMRQLSEILDSIRTNIQLRDVAEKTQTSLDPDWEKAKDYVDSLPIDYITLVKKNGIKGTESLSGKLTRTYFDLGIHKGHHLELVEYTKADGSMHKAWYAMTGKNSVYVRDL